MIVRVFWAGDIENSSCTVGKSVLIVQDTDILACCNSVNTILIGFSKPD